MKKVISLLLALVMVFALAACSGGSGDDGGSNAPASQAPGGSGTSSGESNVSAAPVEEGYPTEIDMTEEPYTVAIQVVGLPGSDFSAIEAELEEKCNAITLPAINAKLDIQFVWISEIVNTTSMAVAGNEKIDLVHVATVNSLSSLVGSDLLLDMNVDNLLRNRGQALIQLFGNLLDAGFVNGKQLAVPAQSFNALCRGIYYNKTLTDAAGITVPEVGTIDDVEKLLYDFHAAYPDKWAWYVGNGQLNYLNFLVGYEGFGQECSYGACLDRDSASPKIENIYASETFKDYCLRMRKWRSDGIISSDTTNSEPAQNYIAAQELFTTPASLNQTLIAEYGANGANNGFEMGFLVTTDYYITNADVTEYMWGIASNSARPDKAMDMLNLIYTNPELANLLKFGIEGENYEHISDSVIAINGSYLPMFYRAGDQSKMAIQAPAGDDFVELTKKDEAGAHVSKLVDYMFDDSDFQAEAAAIYNTIMQYLPTLQSGTLESDDAVLSYIDEFNSKLEASGINDVIAANQAQIDAHLAAK